MNHNLEMSQLQTLIAVADYGSFSRAAENLQVTQSAISQSIKNMEIKLNLQLFARMGKKVVLTLEGEKIYKVAVRLLFELSETLEEVKFDRDSMHGKVRVGTLNGVGKSWLASELLEFVSQEKDLSITIKLGFVDELVRDFENHLLDFLILPEAVLPNTGEKIFLSEEKATFVFPKDLEIDSKIDLESLAKLPTILFEEKDPLYYNFCKIKFGAKPHQVNSKFVINSHGNMLDAVSQGLGVAVIPNHVLKRSHHRSKIGTFGSDFEIANGKFYLLYHQASLDLMRIKKTIERLTSAENPLSIT